MYKKIFFNIVHNPSNNHASPLHTNTDKLSETVLISVIFEHVCKGAKPFRHLLKRDKLLVFSVLRPPPLYNHAEGSDNTKDTRGLTVLSVHRFICAAVIPIWAGRLSTKGTVIYCFRASAAWSMIYLQPGSNESFSIRWMRRTHCRLPLCCSVIHRPPPFTVRIW